jgi:hypothetical protein
MSSRPSSPTTTSQRKLRSQRTPTSQRKTNKLARGLNRIPITVAELQLIKSLLLQHLCHQTATVHPRLIRLLSRHMADHLLLSRPTARRLLPPRMASLLLHLHTVRHLDSRHPTACLQDNNLPMAPLLDNLPTVHHRDSNPPTLCRLDNPPTVSLPRATISRATSNLTELHRVTTTVAPHRLLRLDSRLEHPFAHLAGMPSTTKALSVGTT